MEKTILDTVTWCTLTTVAVLGVAASQDFSHAHGRFIGAGAILAVIAAALKTFPTFTSPKSIATVRVSN